MSRLQHKRGRKSKYASSLNSDYWKEVRQRVIARDRCCQKCGSRLFLEVHHKTYEVNGISIKGNEINHLDKLVLLCAECHKKEHKI
jgi:5-methylcytosine-specific restriction endonuclease McrA